jgi:aminotransferase in exopolysaccharide biosynthesis
MNNSIWKEFIEATFDWYGTSDAINLHEPRFGKLDKEYVADAIDSTFVSSVGPYVDKVEVEIAKICETQKAVAVVNGTSALQVALRLVGVKAGEEVLTQSLSFVATANAIAYNSASPVFIDVDLNTMSLCPKALKSFLESEAEQKVDGSFNKRTGKRIAACVPMHTFGFMAQIDEIVAICEQWNIAVVEDAAEALGSSYKGRKAGSFGDLGAISFNGNKIVTAGGGGAITSNNVALAQKAKHLTTTAKVPHSFEYVHDQLGYNFRMPNLNAALLYAQLARLDQYKDQKKALFEHYSSLFQNSTAMIKPIPKDTTWNYWLTSLALENREERDEFLAYTNEKQIRTRPIWELLYRLDMYKDCQRDDQKNAQYLADRIVNLPSSAKDTNAK